MGAPDACEAASLAHPSRFNRDEDARHGDD
jgi:hypothetical protein